MIKVLFVCPSYRNGGTMTSLKNILELLTPDMFDSYLYCIVDDGPNKDYLEKKVRIVNGSKSVEKNVSFLSRVKRVLQKSAVRIVHLFKGVGLDLTPVIHRILARRMNSLDYDFVVAFQEGQATRFVNMLKAKNKIAWVRSDYSNMMRLEIKHYSNAINIVTEILLLIHLKKNIAMMN